MICPFCQAEMTLVNTDERGRSLILSSFYRCDACCDRARKRVAVAGYTGKKGPRYKQRKSPVVMMPAVRTYRDGLTRPDAI